MTLAEALLLDLTVTNGGGTFRRDTLEPFTPPDGYAVGSAVGDGAVITDPHQLARTVRRVGEEFESTYVGTWVRDDGNVVVDPITYVRDAAGDDVLALPRALTLARRTHQEAIYSFAQKAVIEVTYP